MFKNFINLEHPRKELRNLNSKINLLILLKKKIN